MDVTNEAYNTPEAYNAMGDSNLLLRNHQMGKDTGLFLTMSAGGFVFR